MQKKLKPHAVTCIKNAVFDRVRLLENAGVVYSVHCNREHCWDCTDLISNDYCAVNLKEDGYSLRGNIQRTLKDKTVVCGKRASLALNLEVYCNGCDATIDTAFAVAAEISGAIQSCEAGAEFFAKRIVEQSARRITDTDYSEDKTRLVVLFQVEFDYIPCRPTLVFRRYRNEGEKEE